MNLDSNDFELFDIPRRFAVDRAALDEQWRQLQMTVHPDRFVSEGAAAQRVGMQWAVRVNEAYQRLKDPIKRAAYLCELHGVPVNVESNTAMPVSFLTQQMAWREALDQADVLAAVQDLAAKVAEFRLDALKQLQITLDEKLDFVAASQEVRALMFVERFAQDVDRRLEALGQ